MSCLYILETNPLLISLLANIFSNFVGRFFKILFMVSFAVENILILVMSYLFVLNFHYPRNQMKKVLLQFMSKNCSAHEFPLGVLYYLAIHLGL